MDLGHAGARPRPALHDAHALLAREADAKHVLDAPAKVPPDHGLDVPPVVLRRVVKHAAKHLLELGRQHGALHGNRLPDLEVQAAVGAEQVEQPLGVTGVQLRHGTGRQRLRPEVDLVVQRDEERRRKRAQRPGEPRGVYLAVGHVDGAAGGEARHQPARPSPPLVVLLGCPRGAQLFWRRRSEGREAPRALDASAGGGDDVAASKADARHATRCPREDEGAAAEHAGWCCRPSCLKSPA